MWPSTMTTTSSLLPWQLHRTPPSRTYTISSEYISMWKRPNGLFHGRRGCSSEHEQLEDNGNVSPTRSSPNPLGPQPEAAQRKTMVRNRRDGLLSLALLVCSVSLAQSGARAQADKDTLSLERYSDEKEGFTLLKPSNWKKVNKAGATVLFEDPEAKTNNIGVVVNPVRISSLKEFGTPQDVADKLLEAEKRKPSTNDVRLIRVEERTVHGDIPLYELEYSLDSTRGLKRVLSSIIVASKKLYLLNIAYSDSREKPLLRNIKMSLEQVVDSFDILN